MFTIVYRKATIYRAILRYKVDYLHSINYLKNKFALYSYDQFINKYKL
jgi:hypothetical protein